MCTHELTISDSEKRSHLVNRIQVKRFIEELPATDKQTEESLIC